jgi:hypothetical protein
MKKALSTSFIAGIVLFIFSYAMIYLSIRLFPNLAEEYYGPAFRISGNKDWMFYVHPFVLSFGLKWFWERYKGLFDGNLVLRALEVALVYGLVAMIPVLWLTFSAIQVSLAMAITWLLYGIAQAFIAGLIFARFNP